MLHTPTTPTTPTFRTAPAETGDKEGLLPPALTQPTIPTAPVKADEIKGKIAPALTTPTLESEVGMGTATPPEGATITISSSIKDGPVAAWTAPRGNKVVLPFLEEMYTEGVNAKQEPFVRMAHQQAKADLIEVARLSLKYEDYDWISFALTGNGFRTLDAKVSEVIVALVKEMANGEINLNMHTEAFANKNEASAFFKNSGGYQLVLNTNILTDSVHAIVGHKQDKIVERIKAEIEERFDFANYPLNRFNFHRGLDAIAEPDAYRETPEQIKQREEFEKAAKGWRAEFDKASVLPALEIGEHVSPIMGEALGEAYFHRFKDLLTEAGLASEIGGLPGGDAGHRIAMNAYQDASNFLGAQAEYITPFSHPDAFSSEKDIHDVTRNVLGGQQSVNVTYAADSMGMIFEKDVPLWLNTSLANLESMNLEFLSNIVDNFNYYIITFVESMHVSGNGDAKYPQSLSDDYEFFQPKFAAIREFIEDSKAGTQKLYRTDRTPENIALAKKIEAQINIIEGQLDKVEVLYGDMSEWVRQDILIGSTKGLIELETVKDRYVFDEFSAGYTATVREIEKIAAMDWMYVVRKYVLDGNHGAVRHWLNNHGLSDDVIEGVLQAIDVLIDVGVAVATDDEAILVEELIKFAVKQAMRQALKYGAHLIKNELQREFGRVNFKSPLDLYKHMEKEFGKGPTDAFFGALAHSVGEVVETGMRPIAKFLTPILNSGAEAASKVIESIEKVGLKDGYHKVFEQSDGLISAMSSPTLFTESQDVPKLDESGELVGNIFASPHLRSALQAVDKIFGDHSKTLANPFFDSVFGDNITNEQKDKIREFLLDAVGLANIEGAIPKELMESFNAKYNLSWGEFGSGLIQRHAYVVDRPDDSLEIYLGDHILKAAGKNTDASNLEQMFFADTVVEELIDAAATYAGVRGAEHSEVHDFEDGDIGARGLNFVLQSGAVSSDDEHIKTPHLQSIIQARDALDSDKIILEDGSEVHSRSIEGFLGLFGRVVFWIEPNFFSTSSVRTKDVGFWNQGSLEKYKSTGVDMQFFGLMLQFNLSGTSHSTFLRHSKESDEQGIDRSGEGEFRHGKLSRALKSGDFVLTGYAGWGTTRTATDNVTGLTTRQSVKEDWLAALLPGKGQKFNNLGIVVSASANYIGDGGGVATSAATKGDNVGKEGETPQVWTVNFDMFALIWRRTGIPIVSDLASMGVKNSGYVDEKDDRSRVQVPFAFVNEAKDATFGVLGTALKFLKSPVDTVLHSLMDAAGKSFFSESDQGTLNLGKSIELTTLNKEDETIPVTVTPDPDGEGGHTVSFTSNLEEAQSFKAGPSGEVPEVDALFAAGTTAPAVGGKDDLGGLVKVDLAVDPDTDYVTVTLTPFDEKTGQPSETATPTTFQSERHALPTDAKRREIDPSHVSGSREIEEDGGSEHPIAREVFDPARADLDGDGIANVDDATEETPETEKRHRWGPTWYHRQASSPNGHNVDADVSFHYDNSLSADLGVSINIGHHGSEGKEGARGWGVHFATSQVTQVGLSLSGEINKDIKDKKFFDKDGVERDYDSRGRTPLQSIPVGGFIRLNARGVAVEDITFGFEGFHTDKDSAVTL